jgi:hypothetical protein
MREYFKTLSRLFQPAYMRGEQTYVNEESAKLFSEIPKVINEITPFLFSRFDESTDPCKRKTWYTLTIHAQLCIFLADAVALKARGNQPAAESVWERVMDYVNRVEPLIHDLFDVKYFIDVIGRTIKGVRHFE